MHLPPFLLPSALALLLAIHACTETGGDAPDPLPPEDTPNTPSGDSPTRDTAKARDSEPPPPPPEDHCTEVEAFVPVFAETVARWVAQDTVAPWPAEGLVFVGSSSVRRWEELTRLYAAYGPIHRGFGGAQAGEVALYAEELVLRHQPRAVVAFAGTNDVAAGVSAEIVVERVRCLRQRIPADVPLLFIGITPTPSRWTQWPTAQAVNDTLQALAAADPSLNLIYVDVPAAFLATGAPPDAALFVSDQLHLSEAGYALWESVLRPAVEAALPTPGAVPTPAAGFPSGARLLIDLGPGDGTDGEVSPSPDYLGQHWNNWHLLAGGEAVLPGEHLDDLITDTGAPTGIDLIISGGFYVNGRRNGGLLWPSTDLLGTLAVGSATGDFFYALAEDQTGGLYLRGLDPTRRYSLRFFAAREDSTTRITRYRVYGASPLPVEVTLQTSGSGAGSSGGVLTNDDAAATVSGIQPDAWGHIFVDVATDTGEYAYLSLLEVVAE